MGVPGNKGPCGGTGKGEDQRGFQCDAVNMLLPRMQEAPGISSCALAEVTAEWAKGKEGVQVPFTSLTVSTTGSASDLGSLISVSLRLCIMLALESCCHSGLGRWRHYAGV